MMQPPASRGRFCGFLGGRDTAVEVERHPLDLKEMLPPPELVDPLSGGFSVGD
ncbi:hypothetical protein ACVINI_001267 [Rhizobium beringeri]|jgi:hypothetical protein